MQVSLLRGTGIPVYGYRMDTPIEALARAKRVLGNTESAVAKAIGLRQQSVNEIFKAGRQAPVSWCPALDIATAAAGDRVTCNELRPDFFPDGFTPVPAVSSEAGASANAP